MRPLLLDLFCGAGGAAMGYHRAGFDVIGFDVVHQPNYPFEMHVRDALEVLDTLNDRGLTLNGERVLACDVAAIHASPPCQAWTAYKRRPEHVAPRINLIPETRRLLDDNGIPYVIENIPGARAELRDPVQLCGSSFGLDVRRHRLFESSEPLNAPSCDHSWQTPRFPPATNRTNLRSTVEVGVWRIPLAIQQTAMGIDWMELDELSEAIPPAYTECIGKQLLAEAAEDRCTLSADCAAPFETTIVGWAGGSGWVFDACWSCAKRSVDVMSGWAV